MQTPDELRAIAAKAVTYAKFMRATGWDIHAVRAANDKHSLGLVPVRGGKGKPVGGVACPKPVGAKKKPASGE